MVLDYGCGVFFGYSCLLQLLTPTGTGSFTKVLSGTVGLEGRVYAVDIHPLAVAAMEKLKLPNVKVVFTLFQQTPTPLQDTFRLYHRVTRQKHGLDFTF